MRNQIIFRCHIGTHEGHIWTWNRGGGTGLAGTGAPSGVNPSMVYQGNACKNINTLRKSPVGLPCKPRLSWSVFEAHAVQPEGSASRTASAGCAAFK